MAAHLLRPAGLARTSYCASPSGGPRAARGYTADTTGRTVGAAPVNMTGPFSAGALCSTTRDLATWAAALPSGRVVSRASYAAMTAPRPFARDLPPYGCGLQLETLAGHPVVGHDGVITGFSSRVATYPLDSLVIAVLANTDALALQPLERRLALFALGVPDPAPRRLPVSAADVARAVGRYRARVYGFTVVVRGDAGGLTAEVPRVGRFALRRQAADAYVSEDDHYLRFRFVGSGGRAVVVEMTEPGHAATLDRLP